MEKNHLVITRKPWITSRTLYRVAAVGIATLITQASPGGAASSWGVECLTTDLNNNSYCVTLLSDDTPSDSAAWTLRKSVEDANTRAVTSATIGFKDALFGIQRNDQGQVTNPTNTAKIVVTSTLEIKTNVTITAPTDADGRILLTIERGTDIASGDPLIGVNDKLTPTVSDKRGMDTNKATTEVKIENVTIDSRSNPATSSDASGALSTPGVAIQVKATIIKTETGEVVVTPTVVLSNTVIQSSVSETGGAAINTPGNVQVEGSTLVGNVAITPSGGAPTDGGAIKAGGTVTVVSSALNNNSATGNGGAISASSVSVSNAENSSNSQLNGNIAGGSGGAISAGANVTVSGANLTDNKAIAGNGGAISAVGGLTATSTNLHGNTAGQSGGAISTGADATVNDVGLNYNVAATGSGGAISAGGDATVTASTFNGNNAASGSGGAIEAKGNVSVAGLNAASNTAGASGGVISAGGDVSVSSNSTLQLNTASQSGGAISAEGNVSVSESTLTGNTATTGSGGAIAASGVSSTVVIINSGLGNNTATTGNGGAIAATGATGSLSITNSVLAQNAAKGSGGAIAASGAVTVSSNSVLVFNSSNSGNGGAITAGGDVTIADSGLASNTAAQNGGAIAVSGTSSAVEVTNSVLAMNTATGNGGAISATGTTSAVEVTNSVLAFNTATGNGGAISATGTTSTVSATNSGLAYNNATAGSGGAISATGSTSAVQIKDSSIARNTAGKDGGGISAGGHVAIGSNSSTPISTSMAGNLETAGTAIASSDVSQGTVTGSTSISLNLGSNVYSSSASPRTGESVNNVITNSPGSILFSNTAASGNGGAISAQGAVTVTSGSNIYANTASQDGGAISAGGQVTISASTLNSNTATTGDGGAISAGGQVTISASTLNSNKALDGYGGAVFSGDKVITSSTTSFEENFAEVGGAIAATTSVNISDTEFIDNSAYALGGAILIDSESQDKSSISDSTFEGNYGGLAGGAIFGNEAKLVIGNTDFLYNSADVAGGAIAHGGDLEVIDSTFTGNTASANAEGIQVVRDECEEADGFDKADCTLMVYFEEINPLENIDMGMGSLYGFAGGGAIRVFTSSEVLSLTNQSEEEQNSQNPLPQQTVSILNSEFSKNSAQGDGGAIYFLGLLQILGSRFEENWALPALFFYDPESLPESLPGVRGSGGAIYAEKIEITHSIFDANLASVNGGAIFAESSLEILETEFENNVAIGGIFSDPFEYEGDGGGGAIAAAGSVSVTVSLFANNATFANGGAINLLDGDLTVKKSIFDGNEAFGKGGAIHSLGDLSLSGSTFGSGIPLPNPNYNPERRYRNPAYVAERIEPNPLFGNGQLPRIPNNLYNPKIPSTIPNPSCEGASEFWGNGNTGESWCIVNGIDYPTSIENPDRGWIIDFPNDRYSNEPFLYIEADGKEFVFILDDVSKDRDNYKYNYGGNSSGDDGGAIYVEGEATIKDSSFTGNTSDDDGGAIYSEGTLQVKDSRFKRNWAEDDGGAIRTTPGAGDLFITRTSFTENVSMDGGAVYISTGTVEHYDDVILSSLFRGNEAFGTGGAIDSGYVVLILNTFEDNKSPEGESLDLGGGYLSGNVLIGSSGGQNLCYVSTFISAFANYGTDESCFYGSNNYLLTRQAITVEGALHTLPVEYEGTLLGELQGNDDFYLEVPSDSKPNGVLAPLGTFITNELNKDFNSGIRNTEVSWTAGHLQGIFPEPPIATEVDNSFVDKEKDKPKDQAQNSQEQNSGSNNQIVVNQPGSINLDSPVLIVEPTLSTEELARISQLRAEQLVAEMLRQKEAERIAAENLAKIKADKLARDKARALAAEKRRAQLAALKAKIAATQARGEALKQKPSWTNLMKNSPTSKVSKKLVKMPTK